MTEKKKVKVLYESYPVSNGYAGIPYVTRKTLEVLKEIDFIEVDCLLNINNQYLFLKKNPNHYKTAKVFAKLIDTRLKFSKFFKLIFVPLNLLFPLKLFSYHFTHKEDLIWSLFFNQTLKSNSNLFGIINFKLISIPKFISQMLFHYFNYRTRLNTKEYDYFISHTPHPYKTKKQTKDIIVYYDSIPITHAEDVKNGNFYLKYWYKITEKHIKNKSTEFVHISKDVEDKFIDIFKTDKDFLKRSHVIYNIIDLPNFKFLETINLNKNFKFQTIVSNYIDKLHVSHKRLVDVELAFNKLKLENKTKFFLSIGTIEPRKNTLMLIKLFINYRSINPNVKLILVGNFGWYSNHEIETIRNYVLLGHVIHLSSVPLRFLNILYQYSVAYISLSKEEGHNLPLTEATFYNKPIIASNIPVHREILAKYPTKKKFFVSLHSNKDKLDAIDFILKNYNSIKNISADLDENFVDRKIFKKKWENLFIRPIH